MDTVVILSEGSMTFIRFDKQNFLRNRKFDGLSPQSHISFAMSENLRLCVIFLKDNKLASFLEVYAEFSSHIEEKSRQFEELPLSSFPFKK